MFISNQRASNLNYIPFLKPQDEEFVSVSERPEQTPHFISTGATTFYGEDLNSKLFYRIVDWQMMIESPLDLNLGMNQIKEFIEKYKKLHALEDLCGLIADFTNEQIEIFDEAIKRREFFK